MVLTIVGGFFMVMGSVGLGYPRIIKRIKMMKKSQAQYYHEKFKNQTPENDTRKATRDVIFTLILIAGSALVLFSSIFYRN